MRPCLLVLLACSLGCGPAAPSAAPAATPIVVVSPSAEPVATAATEPPPPTAPQPARAAEISFPSHGTCVLETSHWHRRATTTELRLASDGPIFAKFTSPRAVLHLMTGVASAGAEVENEGLLLRGYVAGDAFELRPSRAFVMGGFAVPTRYAELTWTESHGSDVSISFDVGPSVQPIEKPLSAKVACADVGIESGKFEPEELAGLAEDAKEGLLRTGQSIALATEPGGAPVAQLVAKDDEDAIVKVGRSERGRTLIWWARDTALVFGWVATSQLQKRKPPQGVGYGGGRGVLPFQRSSAVIDTARCHEDVTVIAEVGAQRATVGLIRAGTLIEILGRSESEARVQTRSTRIAPIPEARLLVSTRTLDGCSAQ